MHTGIGLINGSLMYKRYTLESWLDAYKKGDFKVVAHLEHQNKEVETDTAMKAGFADWSGLRSLPVVLRELNEDLLILAGRGGTGENFLKVLERCTMVLHDRQGSMAFRGGKHFVRIQFWTPILPGKPSKVAAELTLDGEVADGTPHALKHAYGFKFMPKVDLSDLGYERLEGSTAGHDVFASTAFILLDKLNKSMGDINAALSAREPKPVPAETTLAKEAQELQMASNVVVPGQIFTMGMCLNACQHRYVLKCLVQFNMRELSNELRAGYPPGVSINAHQQHLYKTLLERKLACEDFILEFTAPYGDDAPVDKGVDLEKFLYSTKRHTHHGDEL